MAGRRKKSTPKIVPKVKEMDEYTMIVERQLQDGNIDGEIVISVKEEMEFQRSHEEDPYVPEVLIKMEHPSFESDWSLCSSPHVVVTNFESLCNADSEQDLDLNLPLSEPLPSTAEVGVANQTRSSKRSQQNGSEVSNLLESPQKTPPCQRKTIMEKTSPKPNGIMFSCDQCSYQSQRRDYLLRHMRIHSGKRPVKCKYCSYTSQFSSTMRVHELIHIGTKPYSCAVCDYRTNDKNKLIPHLRRHYGWKRFKCKKCNWRFVVKAELRAHMAVHNKKKSNPSMSSMQHWKSASPLEMKQHNEKLDKAVQAVKDGMPLKVAARVHCVTVSTLFYRLYPRNLYPPGKKSIKLSTNGIKEEDGNSNSPTRDGKRTYNCKVCGYSTTSSSSALKRHMQTHTGERPYPCNQCDYRAARSRTLRDHMKRHSVERTEKRSNQPSITGKKTYRCNVCEYSTTSSSSAMKKHMRTHTGERPFPCNQCDYRAARSTTLRDHMKRHSVERTEKIHNQPSITSERPFPCNRCDYRAALSSTLRDHMKRHSVERTEKSRNQPSVIRERRHSCTQCDFRATRSTTLRIHMQRHSVQDKPIPEDSDVKISRVTFVGEIDIMAAAAKLPKARVVLHNVMNEQPKKSQPVNGSIPSNSLLGNMTVIKEERINLQPDVESSPSPTPSQPKAVSIIKEEGINLRPDVNSSPLPTSSRPKAVSVIKEEGINLRPDVNSSPLPTSSRPKAVSDSWPYGCTTCNFKASMGFGSEEHQTFPLGFPCSLCNFRSLKIDDLKRHVMSVHIV